MSAVARMLKHRGFSVRGTDSTLSPEVERLRSEGFEVTVGHTGEGIRAEDAVVLTDAIDLDKSPEVARARELGSPLFRRSQALGWLLKPYKVIAVTGTHGKTTTTGMIGAGLKEAGLDPTIVVGASVPQFGGPVVEGKGEWAVVEACEAYDAFHDIDPQVVVLTNLELDHVDFHGNWENLKESIARFTKRVPDDGTLVYCAGDPGAREVIEEERFGGKPWGYNADDLDADVNGTFRLDNLKLPGLHNRQNAAAALTVAEVIGTDVDLVRRGVEKFTGAERRLQVLMDSQVKVIDDYAHHPTELVASLQAIRETMNGGRLIVVFQPHLYSRTADNIPEFAKALDGADVVFITDIYPAREAPIPGVSSARIAELVTKECHYIPSRHLLPRRLAAFAREGDVVVGMGAGNISEFAPDFIKEWQHKEEDWKHLKVAVIYGGDSSEREVSILSGREIHTSLLKQGYVSEMIDVSDLLLGSGSMEKFASTARPDLAFLAVHGTNSEDGAMQGLFELLHIPYTGSGVAASALAMNKAITKEILDRNGIRVPQGRLITSLEQAKGLLAPAVVKPNAEGSTVGLSFVETQDQLLPAVERALTYGGECLVEEWIRGMEISVPVLGDRVLPPVEIAPASGRYDFASKYTPGATEEIVPARLPEETIAQVQQIALRAHHLLGCKGATRTDMIVTLGESRYPYVLEVNTLPGMTSTSLLPNSARAAGMDFDVLVRWLVEDALGRYAAKA